MFENNGKSIHENLLKTLKKEWAPVYLLEFYLGTNLDYNHPPADILDHCLDYPWLIYR